MKTRMLLVVALAVLGVGAFEISALQRENNGLGTEIVTLRQRQNETRAIIERRKHAAAEAAEANAMAAAQLASERARAQAEVKALETQAQAQHAVLLARAAESNRDPQAGVTRVEDLKNVGRATPAAAFQTLAWAGFHGDYQTLAAIIGIDPAAHAEAEQLVAGLSPAMRAKYPTPESVMALLLAQGFVTMSGIQIVNTTYPAPQTAELTVSGLLATDQHILMRQSPSGWQMWEMPSSIAWFRNELAKATAP